MAASIELQRASSEVNAAASGIQAALDRAERALAYYQAQGLSGEMAALAADEVITSNIDKDRAQDAAILSANLIFYLRGEGDGAGNTVLGSAPLNAASLKTLNDRVSI